MPRTADAVADGQQLARGAAANALVLLAANFRAIFTFLIARILGDAALGRFGLALSITELLSKGGMLGLDAGIVPLVARTSAAGDRAGAGRLFLRAVVLGGATSAGVALVAWPILTRLAGGRDLDAVSSGALVMLLALPGMAVARISTGASRGVLRMSSEFYSRGLVETWVTIAVFVIALAVGLRGVAPAVALVGGVTASAIAAFVLARRALATAAVPAASSSDAEPSTAAMLRFTMPTAAASLLNVLVLQLDILLLGWFVGRAPGVTAGAFGVFCAAAEVAGGMRKVRQVFDPVFAPVVAARTIGRDRGALRDTVAAPARWMLAAQLPFVGVLFLSGGAVMAIYGESFRQGAWWVALLAVAHGMNSFAGLAETLLLVERPSLNVVNAVITLIVQGASSLVLIPRYGVTGAAVSMCLGFGVQGSLRFVELRHVFGWSWPWTALRRPALAFAVAFTPALVVRGFVSGVASEAACGAFFLGLYIAAWRWLGADPADRELWRRLFR